MTQSGYYRYPAIQNETVVFTSEDDLWMVPADGGVARRLTSSLSQASRPHLSPDGRWLAFTAQEEGPPELYVMEAAGSEPRRLTYYGSNTRPVGWTREGDRVVFVSSKGQPFPHLTHALLMAPDGVQPEPVGVGPVSNLSFGPEQGMVIGRNTADPARWKRYRGGTAGNIWIDVDGTGDFRELIELKGNLAAPMWVGERIYFLSDHEGYGNIYSCTPTGDDLRRHTDHDKFYARNPQSDGRRIVYHSGGDLYLFDPAENATRVIPIEYHSPRTQRGRKFVAASNALQSYAPHPDGHELAIVARGKPFTIAAFAGAPTQFGIPDGVRYRAARFLSDGRRLVAVSDSSGNERLVVFDPNEPETEDRYDDLDIGRPVDLQVSPTADVVAISNHRNEVLLVDLQARTLQQIDRSATLHDGSLAFSPDGRWLAFNHAEHPEKSYLMIASVETGDVHQVTEPLLNDINPSFDPEGRYLYFLSFREFDPVYDNLHFDLGFPRGMRPYVVTLRKDVENPFLPKPKAPNDVARGRKNGAAGEPEGDGEEKSVEPVEIDFDGITRRLIPMPVEAGRYTDVAGARGRIFILSEPIVGSLSAQWSGGNTTNETLRYYDLETQKVETLDDAIDDFEVAQGGRALVYRAGSRLRVVPATARPDERQNDEPGADSGWVDIDRISVQVHPGAEWRQMYDEAWRLQREFFWTEGMLGIDWDAVHQRYLPLVARLGSRGEVSDLLWEMQGELGTSHAYEMGGDYRHYPNYAQGHLGAEFVWDESATAWRIEHIIRGDAWSERFGSPLESPGVNLREGAYVLAINGRTLSRENPPERELVNTAGSEVVITVRPADSEERRTVRVKTSRDNLPVRYREWVESNRRRVHEATDGRVGYVHVPNMGPWGYSEFHRGFLSEVWHGSMIVDVRFNGGGHVSQLILEKLARRRIGYNQARYTMPEPYPSHSLGGPVVALTNEYAGSDGDIFSHGFKLMKLGPLIGKRTWGGVVGIWPRNPLVDGSVTTQPEFSFWFEDVAWGVENYGTDPDIEVDLTPQDYARGYDAQLERAIAEINHLLETDGHTMPDLSVRPVLRPAPLPKRDGEVKAS